MDIHILGAHNSESVDNSCVTFVVDDKLAVEAGGLTSHLSARQQRNIDAVILTHHHMDHIRDIPGMAFSFFAAGASLDIYAPAAVNVVIQTHFLNKMIYPEFQKIPAKKPTVNFLAIEPYSQQRINGFTILPLPVCHPASSVGYQISDKQGKVVFYTGDTGPDLADCWRRVSPQLLIIEVTMPDKFQDFAVKTGHLTPHLLEHELKSFRDIKGYLPQVVAIHLDASQEPEIREELAAVAANLPASITIAHEGMHLYI